MKTMQRILLFLVVVAAVVLRLYKLNNPVADWHSFRQADTASVARNFVRHGIDLLHPTYHDLSNIQSGKDNPQGWRMVEFPLYQGTAAAISRTFPGIPVELSLRMVSIVASAGTALILGSLFGVTAGFVYAVLPFSVFYGRAILPEAFAVFWAMLAIYALDKKKWFFSACAAAIALLVKPTAGFLLLPIPYILFRHYKISVRSLMYLFIYVFICLFPFGLWRQWILQYPEGIAAFDWLLNKDNIRFKGAWFHWLFAKRIGELILGFWGLIPFGMGLLKVGFLDGLLGLGGLLYLIVFAAGNVQHDYYQVILLPMLALFAGRGFEILLKKNVGLAAVCFLFMIAFSWYTVRTYYWINRPEILAAGAFANRLLPQDAKVIAPYNGDTTFLYQTGRSGWPLGFDIEKKIAMGATHYVTVSPTDNDWETKTLAETYTVIVRNDAYAIIDLTKPRQ